MRTWNYRVIERVTPLKTPSGATDVYRAIHEVHYESDGRPVAYSEHPATIGWNPTEGDDAPLVILDRMHEALAKPCPPLSSNRIVPRGRPVVSAALSRWG